MVCEHLITDHDGDDCTPCARDEYESKPHAPHNHDDRCSGEDYGHLFCSFHALTPVEVAAAAVTGTARAPYRSPPHSATGDGRNDVGRELPCRRRPRFIDFPATRANPTVVRGRHLPSLPFPRTKPPPTHPESEKHPCQYPGW